MGTTSSRDEDKPSDPLAILDGLDPSYHIAFRHLALEATPVAAGGSGQVYRASWHGAPVAVKALFSQMIEEDNVDELKAEVAIISRLHHPNVVAFLGVSHSDGRYFMVTEWCPRSLEVEVGLMRPALGSDAPPFGAARFAETGAQILRSIVYLHDEKGIVHRDIKPPNVLLTSDGTVKICDLGAFVSRKHTMTLQCPRGVSLIDTTRCFRCFQAWPSSWTGLRRSEARDLSGRPTTCRPRRSHT